MAYPVEWESSPPELCPWPCADPWTPVPVEIWLLEVQCRIEVSSSATQVHWLPLRLLLPHLLPDSGLTGMVHGIPVVPSAKEAQTALYSLPFPSFPTLLPIPSSPLPAIPSPAPLLFFLFSSLPSPLPSSTPRSPLFSLLTSPPSLCSPPLRCPPPALLFRSCLPHSSPSPPTLLVLSSFPLPSFLFGEGLFNS